MKNPIEKKLILSKKNLLFNKKTLDFSLEIVYYIQALCDDLTSKQYGPLAQWLERSAHNRLVRGSNP